MTPEENAMHNAPPGDDTSSRLSEHDPPADATRDRPPYLVIIIVVALVTAVVVLHLAGVVGPGSR
jgi:hypothetical protein